MSYECGLKGIAPLPITRPLPIANFSRSKGGRDDGAPLFLLRFQILKAPKGNEKLLRSLARLCRLNPAKRLTLVQTWNSARSETPSALSCLFSWSSYIYTESHSASKSRGNREGLHIREIMICYSPTLRKAEENQVWS